MHVEDPRFPPLLTGYGVKAPMQPFVAACQGAMSGTYGAADVIWSRNTERIELALVLEPDVPRKQALEIVPLFQLAVIEALGSLMPPQTSVLLRWPDALLVNAGIAGHFRFSVAPSRDDEVPDWMVASAAIQLVPNDRGIEPGQRRDFTTLVEEGSDSRTRSDFLEVIASYTLSWINTWQDDGIAALADSWVGRIEGHQDPAIIATQQAGKAGGLTGRDANSFSASKAAVLGLSDDLGLLVKFGEGEGEGEVLALPISSLIETPSGIATDQSGQVSWRHSNC